MNVKELLMSVNRHELREQFLEYSEWGLALEMFDQNFEAFFNEISELEPVETGLVVLYCAGNEPTVEFFDRIELERIYDPNCALLHLQPEKLSDIELRNICQEWDRKLSCTVELLPWPVILGAEVDSGNLMGHSAIGIAVEIMLQVSWFGFDKAETVPERRMGIADEKNPRAGTSGIYVRMLPLEDGSGYMLEPEVFAFRRFLYQRINLYKVINAYMNRMKRVNTA